MMMRVFGSPVLHRALPGLALSALAAVMIDHRALDRVQRPVGRGDPLDRAHRLAVQLRQEQDAGVQRA